MLTATQYEEIEKVDVDHLEHIETLPNEENNINQNTLGENTKKGMEEKETVRFAP